MTLERKEKIKRISMRALHIFCYVCTGLFFLLLIIGFANSGSKSTKKSEEYYPRNVTSEITRNNLYFENQDENYVLVLQTYEDWINFLGAIQYVPSNIESFDIGDSMQSLFNEGVVNFIVSDTDNSTFVTFDVDDGENVFNIIFDYEDGSPNYREWILSDESYGDVSSLHNYVIYDVYAQYPEGNYGYLLSLDFYNAYMIGYDADNLFGGLTESLTDFVGTLNEGTEDVITLFYDDGLTTLGIFATMSVAVVLAWVGFRIISGLVRLRG